MELPHPRMWVVYGKQYCPYAIATYKLLKARSQTYRAYDVDAIGARVLLHTLGDRIPSSHNTTPIIFYNTRFIGGYSDLLTQIDKILE